METHLKEILFAAGCAAIYLSVLVLLTQRQARRYDMPVGYHWRGMVGISVVAGLLTVTIIHTLGVAPIDIPPEIGDFQVSPEG